MDEEKMIRETEIEETKIEEVCGEKPEAENAAAKETEVENGKAEEGKAAKEPERSAALAAAANIQAEAARIRRGDKIASGVLGALLGALITLLVMIPLVFTMKGGGQSSDGESNRVLAEKWETLSERIDLEKMEEIFEYLDAYFLYSDDVDPAVVEDAVLHGLMSGLGDDYAYYYNEEEFKELMESNEGKYYGIGVQVSQNLETYEITVTHVFRNSPALEAGMKEGDVIIGVAGQDIRQLPVDEVVNLIKGDEGSTVEIIVYRESTGENVTLQVERRQVEQDFVYWEMLEDEVGYIELIQFAGNAAEQFGEALKDLTAQGMEGLVLDLRGNPGGLLDSVLDIAEQLLPGGTVLTIKSNYTSDQVYSVPASGFDTPLVVLVDGYSASASEVLSGAIQDYGVGTLVGTTTYGKGIVQNIIQLGDGMTGIKFTTSDYYTPNGRNIHGVGIEPDVVVEFDAESEADNQLEKALEVLKQKMK